MAPLIITTPGPVPYSSDKVVPWNCGAEVYYHGVKQEPWITENEEPKITNISRTSMVTMTGRIFSPEISPPTTTITLVRIPAAGPTANARGKEKIIEAVWTKAPSKDVTIEDPSR